MRNRLWTTLAGLLVTTLAPAQNFNKLWKNYDAAIEADRPRTAISVAGEIARKALDKGDDGQLVKALFAERSLWGSLSPDSMTAATARLERRADAEERKPLRAVIHSLLAEIYAGQRWEDTANVSRAASFYRASVSDFAALAATKAETYVPAVVTGKDSHYFRGDLLSLIGRRATEGLFSLGCKAESRALSARLFRHYADAGQREAALLLTLDSLNRDPGDDRHQPLAQRKVFAALSALAERFADLPLNVETYIALIQQSGRDEADDSLSLVLARRGLALYGKEKRADLLRNTITTIENPTVSIDFPVTTAGIPDAGGRYAYPGQPFRAAVRHKNVSHLRLVFHRIQMPLPAFQNSQDDLEKLTRGLSPALTYDFRPKPAPSWHTCTDTVSLSLAQPGLYVVTVMVNGEAVSRDWLTVSRYKLLQLHAAGPDLRFAAVDVRTGAPAAGLTLRRMNDAQPAHLIDSITTDADGIGTLRQLRQSSTVYLSTPAGDWAWMPVGSERFSSRAPRKNRQTFVYTDRAVYRPGQDVRLSLISYEQLGDSARTVESDTVCIRLADTNGRTVAADTLTTDASGMAACTLRLPSSCLPGTFRLVAGTASRGIRVEEYKRPTFTASLTVPATDYAPGDSVTLTGSVRTYTDVPVADATVRYTIDIVPNIWYRLPVYSSIPESKTLTGTTTTDAEGHYTIGLLATLPETDSPTIQRGHRYVVRATVTAPNGESAEASTTLVVNQWPSTLSAVWPSTMYSARLPQLTFNQYNSNRQNLTARGEYAVLRGNEEVARDTFTTGSPFCPTALATLPAGTYRIISRIIGATSPVLADTTTVILFTDNATRMPAGTPQTCHAVLNERGDSAVLFLSLPDTAYVYASVVSTTGETEHRLLRPKGNVLRLDYAYRPAYGDGATIALAYVSQGRLHTHTCQLRRPEPQKRLQLTWQSFRNRLRPGQDEEWRLRVTYPDGRPARAALTATLYDASLDRFAPLNWPVRLSFPRFVPYASWSSLSQTCSSYAALDADYRHVAPLSFDHFDPSLCSSSHYFVLAEGMRPGIMMDQSVGRMTSAGTAPRLSVKASARQMNATAAMEKTVEATENPDAVTGFSNAATDESATASVRTDFAETAYFAPMLHTDADGVATLRFTLPESTTSWNFRAVAHTTGMDLGALDTTVIASKPFTVAPNLPRFLRSGDATTIPVTLRNLNSEAVSGKVYFTLTDAVDGQTVVSISRPFHVEANAQANLTFDCRVDTLHPLLACRIVAESTTFSDGEAHYLPVLSDQSMTVRSVPFTAEQKGKTAIDLSALAASGNPYPSDSAVTVEVTANPEWAAVAALPALSEPRQDDAFSLAASYYALTLGQAIAEANPAVSEAFRQWRDAETLSAERESPLERNAGLKQLVVEETPWLAASSEEKENRRRLADLLDPTRTSLTRYSALDRLAALQNADGSWSWFKGMTGSTSVTTDVAMMLARLQALVPDDRAASLLNRAGHFLDRAMADETAGLRKQKRPDLSSNAVRYLYINALTGRSLNGTVADNAEYLKKLLRQPGMGNTLTDKALVASTLSLLGETDAARERVKSLEERLVERPGMGWMFDAAPQSAVIPLYAHLSANTALSAHTAYVEAALRTAITTSTRFVDGVRKWMILTRHTTYWDDPRQAADAVYGLFCQSPLSSRRLFLARPQRQPSLYLETADGRQKPVTLVHETPATAIGYYNVPVRLDKGDGLPARLIVTLPDSGLVCGAVYARYVQPTAEVTASAAGLSVKRTLEVWRDGQWLAADGKRVQTGERLRMRFDLTADRDYDFVCLKATRPACLEPRQPLSGYTFSGGLGCYRACLDASTRYFFDHISKGHHTLTDEFTADRPGTYSCGLAEVRCCYAPEFGGYTEEQTLLCQ